MEKEKTSISKRIFNVILTVAITAALFIYGYTLSKANQYITEAEETFELAIEYFELGDQRFAEADEIFELATEYVELGDQRFAEANAINMYTIINLVTDFSYFSSKLYYITDDYVVLVQYNSSLDTTIDIKDDVKVDTTSSLSIEGIDFDVNDWVVLESDTDKIYKYTSKNDGSTVTYVWTAYKIVNGRLQTI